MTSSLIDSIYSGLHPALGSVEILYWHELKKSHNQMSLFLYGDSYSCRLFVEWFKPYGIAVEGIILSEPKATSGDQWDIPVFTPDTWNKSQWENSAVVVTLRDFPGNIDLYHAEMDKLGKMGVSRPYIIHDFSSGFALGAEKIVESRMQIENAINCLEDEDSKQCFIAFLQHLNVPHHWNMDITAETFGIPDPKRTMVSEWEDPCDCSVSSESVILFCNTVEWHGHDPKLALIKYCKDCILFFPHSLARLKLREYIGCGRVVNAPIILSSALWDSDGEKTFHVPCITGGTPLSYESKVAEYKTVTVDSVMAATGKFPDLIVLDMDNAFPAAIHGAHASILAHHPSIAVNGFSRAHFLWNAVNELHRLLPHYSIYLRRYPSENPMEGHTIFLKYEGD